MNTPTEKLLRQTLHAKADEFDPPEDLYERVSHHNNQPKHSRLLLIAAASLLIVVGIVASRAWVPTEDEQAELVVTSTNRNEGTPPPRESSPIIEESRLPLGEDESVGPAMWHPAWGFMALVRHPLDDRPQALWTSSDGMVWAEVGPVDLSRVVVDMAATDDRLVILEQPSPRVSSDAIHWTLVNPPDLNASIITGTDLGFVAVGGIGGHPTAWWSSDGEDWEVAELGGEGVGDARGVTYAQGRFVATGYLDYRPVVWQSTDGRRWTAHKLPFEGRLEGIGQSVATGPGGVPLVVGLVDNLPAVWSPDGDGIWTLVPTVGFEQAGAGIGLYELAGNEAGFVAGLDGDGAWYSVDGVNWARTGLPVDPQNGIGLLVAGGNRDFLVTDFDRNPLWRIEL